MNNISSSKIPIVAESVLREIEERIVRVEEKQYNELVSLYSIFGQVFQRALDILEKSSILVSYVTSNKQRTLIEIPGDNDRCYRLFSRINFCPCRAFKHQVLERRSICCKHVLAARIAQILGKLEEQTVSQEHYLILMKSMYELGE